jgi:hypothetical protein
VTDRDEVHALRIDSVAAGVRLAQSRRFRTALIALGALLWSGAVGVSGWIGGKLELRYEVDELTKQVKTLSGKVEVLTSQQADLVKALHALTEGPRDGKPGGTLFVMDAELTHIRRDLVRSYAAIYAGESAAARRHKAKVAEDFATAHKNLMEQGNTRSAAAETLQRTVAVP